MRLIALVIALLFTAPAFAQDWKEYENRDYAFIVNFPVDPEITDASYPGPDGRAFAARVYSVTLPTGIFKLTIAEVPEGGTEESALVNDAVKKMTDGAVIKFDMQHRIRAVYGRQLGIAGANGGYAYVAVFYRNKRLYQIEGRAYVAGGQAEIDAMRFQQSLDFT